MRVKASRHRQRRRAPRPLTIALADLLRAHRPPMTSDDDQGVVICLTPDVAGAIARIAARRNGSLASHADHPAREATRRAICVSPATAAQWRRDAWQAAGEGLIAVAEAQLLSAQIDPPSTA